MALCLKGRLWRVSSKAFAASSAKKLGKTAKGKASVSTDAPCGNGDVDGVRHWNCWLRECKKDSSKYSSFSILLSVAAPAPMPKPEELQNCGVYLDLFHSCSCKNDLIYIFPIMREVAFKGRLRTYYREGKVNSCMPYWNDFWFCLKAKVISEVSLQVSFSPLKFILNMLI